MKHAPARHSLTPRGQRTRMAFDADIQYFPSITAFNAYLRGVPRPAWAQGITHHNTYKPNELTWQGRASMQSMMAYYIGKGWSSGPHLYLAAAAKNRANTGIWQLTPLAHPGTHAGQCNKDHVGIESVGDFDARPPTPDQYTLLITVTLLIMRHWGLPPEAVNVHNECMVGRTCPGKFLTGAQIRADLRKPAPPRPVPRLYRAVSCAPVFEDRRPDAPLALTVTAGTVERMDDLTGGWLHLESHAGFSPISCWEPT